MAIGNLNVATARCFIHDFSVFYLLFDKSGDSKAFVTINVATGMLWLDTTVLGHCFRSLFSLNVATFSEKWSQDV